MGALFDGHAGAVAAGVEETVSVSRQDLRFAVMGAAVIVAQQLSSELLQEVVFPIVVVQQPLIREFQCVAGLLVAVSLLLACMYRPRFLAPRGLLVLSMGEAVLSGALLFFGSGSPVALALGCALYAMSDTWAVCQCGILLGRIRSQRVLAASVVAGLLASSAVLMVVPLPAYGLGALSMLALVAVMLAVPMRVVRPLMESISSGQANRDLALANPRSFLGPFHQVFVLMFVFALASQFSVALCADNGFTPGGLLSLALMAAFGIWFVLVPSGMSRADTLFGAASLLMVAGLLLAVLDRAQPGNLSHGLLDAGSLCYTVLGWLVVASLCMRNPAGSVYAVSARATARGLGVLAGAALGHACSAVAARDPRAAGVIVAVVLLGYIAYMQFGLRGFSFADTLAGVEPAVEVLAPQEGASAVSRDEMISRACGELAVEYGLTAREAQVVGLLCRGYSGKRIQEDLSLGYNTVKTHAKHAYRKLDVHSQQELIDLVEKTAAQ